MSLVHSARQNPSPLLNYNRKQIWAQKLHDSAGTIRKLLIANYFNGKKKDKKNTSRKKIKKNY